MKGDIMYNYNYSNDQWYGNMNNNLYRNANMPSLFTPEDAYNKGNLFADLYSQYKNYKPVILKGKNEKENMLLELSRLSFASHELNLYLDLHPEDNSIITLFNDYRTRANELTKKYEEKYGPLNITSDSLNETPFMWVKDVWPWEEKYYV